MKKVTKIKIQNGLRWGLFVMAAITMSLKIAEVSAYSSYKILLEHPEVAQYSTLVNSGYLFFK